MAEDEDDAAYRRRRAADTARWRSRCRRKVQLFQIEADEQIYDLMIKYGGLREAQAANKKLAQNAFGKLLRRSLAALLDAETRKKL